LVDVVVKYPGVLLLQTFTGGLTVPVGVGLGDGLGLGLGDGLGEGDGDGLGDGVGVGLGVPSGKSKWTWKVNDVPAANVAPVCQLKFTR